MVAVKFSLRIILPRLSMLGSSLVFVSVILKPASFVPLVTAPRQAWAPESPAADWPAAAADCVALPADGAVSGDGAVPGGGAVPGD